MFAGFFSSYRGALPFRVPLALTCVCTADFFRALTVITSAVLVPLTTASLLSHVIVASALEQMDMDRIIQEVGLAVGERVHGGGGDVDDVARELQQKLMLRGESTKQMKFESIHVSAPDEFDDRRTTVD